MPSASDKKSEHQDEHMGLLDRIRRYLLLRRAKRLLFPHTDEQLDELVTFGSAAEAQRIATLRTPQGRRCVFLVFRSKTIQSFTAGPTLAAADYGHLLKDLGKKVGKGTHTAWTTPAQALQFQTP